MDDGSDTRSSAGDGQDIMLFVLDDANDGHLRRARRHGRGNGLELGEGCREVRYLDHRALGGHGRRGGLVGLVTDEHGGSARVEANVDRECGVGADIGGVNDVSSVRGSAFAVLGVEDLHQDGQLRSSIETR